MVRDMASVGINNINGLSLGDISSTVNFNARMQCASEIIRLSIARINKDVLPEVCSLCPLCGRFLSLCFGDNGLSSYHTRYRRLGCCECYGPAGNAGLAAQCSCEHDFPKLKKYGHGSRRPCYYLNTMLRILSF